MSLRDKLRKSRDVTVTVDGIRVTMTAYPPSASDYEAFQVALEEDAGVRLFAEVLATCVDAVDGDDEYPTDEADREEYWLDVCGPNALMQLVNGVFTGGDSTAGKSER